MRKEYDAFGRPVEPGAPGSSGRPTAAPRPSGTRPAASPRPATPPRPGGERSRGASSARGAGTVVPEVDGLPTVSGGGPVESPVAKQFGRAVGAAGSAVALLLVVIGVVGSLADDGGSSRGSGARSDPARVTPVTAERAGRAMSLLRERLRSDDRVVSVSLSASYATARVLRADGGGARSIFIDEDDDVRTSASTVGSATSRGVPTNDLELSAPRSIVEAVTRGLGPGSPGRISSVSAYAYRDEPLRWTVSVVGGPEVARSWTADDAGRSVVRTRDGAPAPPAGEPGPATVPKGLSGRSLLVPANLNTALATLGALPALQDRTPGEIRLASLSLGPTRLLAGVVEGRNRRLVSVDAAFGLDPSGVSPDAGEDAVALPEIDSAGPARALRTIARRLRTDAAARVGTISLASAPTGDGGAERPVWFIALEGEGRDRVWRASLDGRLVGRSGEDLTP